MASLRDSDTENRTIEENPLPDFAPTDTQILPSSSLGEKGEGANELGLLKKMTPFDDTVPDDDEFETQVLNFGGETQVLDDPDDITDTQLIEDFKDVAFGSDGEETDRTEVLADGDEVSDGESKRRGDWDSMDGERTQRVAHCGNDEKEWMENTDGLTEELPSSGTIPKFTSVRTASLRASGIAAHTNALKGSCESYSPQSNGQFSEQHCTEKNGLQTEVSKEVDQECDAGRCSEGVKGLRDRSSCKVNCHTVKKLFTENLHDGDGFNIDIDSSMGGKEVPQMPTLNDGLAGLSYVDSQEPGELSQANALACVQRLIDENKMMFDDESNHGKRSRDKSLHVSTAKGTQNLAKKANDRGMHGKSGTFDWDDEREDEGGGDFFCRRKEELFGNGNLGLKYFTDPHKHKGKHLDGNKNNEGKLNVHNEAMTHTDSKIVLCNIKDNSKTAAQETELNVRKNLVYLFNEQYNIETSTEQLKANLAEKEMVEMLNVGLDTQIAAEAMEALCQGEGNARCDANDANLGKLNKWMDSPKGSSRKTAKRSVRSKDRSFNKKFDIGVTTRYAGRTKRIGTKSSEQTLIASCKLSEDVEKECHSIAVTTRRKRDAEKLATRYGSKIKEKVPAKTVEIEKEEQCIENLQLTTFTPIAHRTRQSSRLKSAHNVSSDCANESNLLADVRLGVEGSKVLSSEKRLSEPGFGQAGEVGCLKSKLRDESNGTYPKRRRSRRNLSDQLNQPENLIAQSKPPCQPDNIVRSTSGCKRSLTNARITADITLKKARLSTLACPDLCPIHRNSLGESSPQNSDKPDSDVTDLNNKKLSADVMGPKGKKLFGRERDSASPSAESKMNESSDRLPKEIIKPSELASTSPGSCMKPVNAVSPICMGDGYYEKSCKKSLSRSCLTKEISNLVAISPEPPSPAKDLRKRRDLATVRVLFSHHLDGDIVKKQRKIADRLNVSIASAITDATHFVTDTFVRTRNMLEAIASGKPVVTPLWLENVGRAKYYIDEQKFILRDMKKEKEFGFNMTNSLAHARQHPLLQGRRVLITPNVKPSKEIISELVTAVQGLAVERVGRSAQKDDIVADNLLVLSCEEDYEACVAFLEKGASVYSSELLLNGIVTQKLEYERHQLFADHVKRTRSTIWLKKDGHNFIPVPKNK